MRSLFCLALTLMLIGSTSLVSVTTSATGRNSRIDLLKKVKTRVEAGATVGKKIKQLRQTNKRLQAALDVFERNGHQPRFDEAFSIFGRIDNSPAAYTPAKYTPQQATITGDGVEVTFISAVNLYNEWQGTIISTFYDANGAVEDQSIADVVITRSEYSPSEWTVRYELQYEADGVGYLNQRPGMFTNFALGTPIQEQAPPPLSLLESQFATAAERDTYYAMYPEQELYDYQEGGGTGGGGSGIIMNAHARKAPQRGVPPGVGPWTFYTLTGWGGAARAAGIGCTAAAGGCGLASALFAGASFGPCFVAGCAGSVIVGVVTNIRPTPRRRP